MSLRRDRGRQAFDALRGVSFETYPGECFGIVGSNGSGKSTVLQILAGITLPSSGSMLVRGTVLPLLAVGAGLPSRIDLKGEQLPVRDDSGAQPACHREQARRGCRLC